MRAIPWAKRVCFIRPFRGDGVTAGGIVIEHSTKLPPIYGRVISVHPSCLHVRVGDWVVYPAHKPIRIEWTGGVVYSLREEHIVAIVLPDGGQPWFYGMVAAA